MATKPVLEGLLLTLLTGTIVALVHGIIQGKLSTPPKQTPHKLSTEVLYFSNEELSCGPLPRLLRSWFCVRVFNTDRSYLV